MYTSFIQVFVPVELIVQLSARTTIVLGSSLALTTTGHYEGLHVLHSVAVIQTETTALV